MNAVLAPSVVIDWGSTTATNLGDLAMLESLARRLRVHWPHAEIRIPVADAAALDRIEVATSPVPPHELRGDLLPGRLGTAVLAADRLVQPVTGRGRVGRAVAGADLVLAAGGGYLTDHFRSRAHAVLHLLHAGARRGASTAAFGQGLGPLDDRVLRAHSAHVLRQTHLVTVRDHRSQDLARSLGASSRVTGDDALEVAVTGHRAEGTSIGLSIRLAGYAGIDRRSLRRLRHSLASVLCGQRVVVVPISQGSAESDLSATLDAVGAARRATVDVARPSCSAELRRTVAGCAVMVTATYHAAVFALAQGVPVVGIVASPYYETKMGGLQSLFGDRMVRLLGLDQAGQPCRLAGAIEAALRVPAGERDRAVATACRQRDAGRAAVAELAERVEANRQDRLNRPPRPHR